MKIELSEEEFKTLFRALEIASNKDGSWNEFQDLKQKIMQMLHKKYA